MDNNLATISLPQLAFAFIPVMAVFIILAKWSMPTTRAFHALIRMLVQLLLVGFVLSYLFTNQSAWLIALLLFIMVLYSSYIALSNLDITKLQQSDSGLSKTTLFRRAFIAIIASSVFVLFFITQGVLNLDPWYQAQTLVPLAGMVFANAMNSVSLCGERFYSELNHTADYYNARNTAFKASMIPNINALFAVGVVSLPGMMTGQILAGVSPFIATRYQIMVMCMVFASAGLASAIFLALSKNKVIKN